MKGFLLFVVLVLTPLVECRVHLRSEATNRFKQVQESFSDIDGDEGRGTRDVSEKQEDVNERNRIELREKGDKKILKQIKKLVGVVDGKADSLVDINSNQNAKLDLIIEAIMNLTHPNPGLVEVNVVSSGGEAYATSTHSTNEFEPIYAFDGSGRYWHSAHPWTVPQTLWVEFPNVIKVVAYSFTSASSPTTYGPSKYFFWGSNHGDCTDESKWEVLKEDNSGTPFTITNHPKSEVIINTNSYKCYGFKITDVPGRDGFKAMTVGNVHLYEDKA